MDVIIDDILKNDYILHMEKYAKDNHVPIIQEEALAYIVKLVKDKNVHNILEIGTAIGYFSSVLAFQSQNIYVDTIERDEKMFEKAIENISTLNLNSQIYIL